MNLVYFHTHDMGRYIQPYGYGISTPHMQKLAEEGCTFRNAFSIAPTCSPSRAALLTGQYPHQCGMFGLTNEGWRLNDYDKHLVSWLKKNGFETALAGSHHEDDPAPSHIPYDYIFNSNCIENRFVTTGYAVEYIRRAHNKPFFLSVGYDNNHNHRIRETVAKCGAFLGEPDSRYVRGLPHVPDLPGTRGYFSELSKAVQYEDIQLGRIRQALRDSRLDSETIILFTTDHGPSLPYAKRTLTDAGTGVALILWAPGRIPCGRVIEPAVTHLDVYPSLCDLLRLDKPDWLEGRSLLPLINGETECLHDAIYLQQTYHGEYMPLRAVRTGRYKYVRRYGDIDASRHFLSDDNYGIGLIETCGYDQWPFEREQLYDLYYDTCERMNLISHPNYVDTARLLRQMLTAWQTEKQDPILHGDIPPCSVMNKKDI